MLYIHQYTCISPQKTFGDIDINTLVESSENKLKAIEPAYEGIPPGILRRMGKAVRMGVGAALPIVKNNTGIDGIIIGTANGGMEDCIKFLNQIIDYDEGMLTPGNFVQSTANAIAGQLGLMTKNKSYNITHVHRGLAFETAVIDAAMMVKENPGTNYLLGAVDEISSYNFNIDFLDGWYKKDPVSNKDLYNVDSPASLAGEGAAMFLVNDRAAGAVAHIKAMKTFHGTDRQFVKKEFEDFVTENFKLNDNPDLLLTGENGDNRLTGYYDACQTLLPRVPAIRYKHMCGEYPTTASFAYWLICTLLNNTTIPLHMGGGQNLKNPPRKILLYNNYKGYQHSLAVICREN
jgi:hypothetical protein